MFKINITFTLITCLLWLSYYNIRLDEMYILPSDTGVLVSYQPLVDNFL